MTPPEQSDEQAARREAARLLCVVVADEGEGQASWIVRLNGEAVSAWHDEDLADAIAEKIIKHAATALTAARQDERARTRRDEDETWWLALGDAGVIPGASQMIAIQEALRARRESLAPVSKSEQTP